MQPDRRGESGPTVPALFRELRNYRADRRRIRQLRIGQLHTLYFTYVLDAALQLPDADIRENRTFLLTPYFLYLLLVADILMEEYAHLFTVEELERELEAARRSGALFRLSSGDLIARGAEAAKLNALARRRELPATGDPWRLIFDAARAIDEIISAQACAHDYQREARRAFVDAYNGFAGSAVLERRLIHAHGPFPPVDAVWRYLRAKSTEPIDRWLDCLLGANGRDPRDHAAAKQMLCSYVFHIAGVDDDVRDVALDHGRQPNLVLSVACHRFPGEHARLETLLEQGDTFRGLRGRARLARAAPQTIAYLESERSGTRKNLERDGFFRLILVAQRALIAAKQARDCIRAMTPPHVARAVRPGRASTAAGSE